MKLIKSDDGKGRPWWKQSRQDITIGEMLMTGR